MPFKNLSPARILYLIREGVRSLPELLDRLGVAHAYTHAAQITHVLDDLERVHFIEPTDNYQDLRVTAKWRELQAALGISLRDVSSLTGNSIIVTPVFNSKEAATNSADVFVAMPFEDSLKAVFEDHIKPVINRIPLTIRRADDLFATHGIMEDVWKAVLGSKIVIADCTGKNPNVFYEIGIAHTVGRPVILITQRADDVPFDLRHLRYILYSFTPRGMDQFEQVLRKTVDAIREGID